MSARVPPRAGAAGPPAPTREQASPLDSRRQEWPDPYRLLFPIGLTWALVGAGVWPLWALGVVPYPGLAHRLLMIQGFEHSFVLGFLLTAIPGFTKGERCQPGELAIALLSAVVFGLAALAGRPLVAQGVFVLSVIMLLVAVLRRVRHARLAPPLELMFVGFGLLMGLAGGLWQLAAAAGRPAPLPGSVGERLVSLGMVLSLVLGVGSLLVPTFAGMRDPLMIPGIARAHERRGRMAFYAALIAVFALAFAAELAGRPRAGAWLRALAASVIGLMVWKLWRLPGRRDVPAFALWTAGWLVMAGLWAAAAGPAWTLAGLHLAFIGGFGLLTLGIGTRVVVAHGHFPLGDERATLSWWVAAAIALALIARLMAEWSPARTALLGVSGAAWVAGWSLWAFRALPRIARTRAAARPPATAGAGRAAPPAARPERPAPGGGRSGDRG